MQSIIIKRAASIMSNHVVTRLVHFPDVNHFVKIVNDHVVAITEHLHVSVYDATGYPLYQFSISHKEDERVNRIVFDLNPRVGALFLAETGRSAYLVRYYDKKFSQIEVPTESTCIVSSAGIIFVGFEKGRIVAIKFPPFGRQVRSLNMGCDQSLQEFINNIPICDADDKVNSFVLADFNQPVVSMAWNENMNCIVVAFKTGIIKTIDPFTGQVHQFLSLKTNGELRTLQTGCSTSYLYTFTLIREASSNESFYVHKCKLDELSRLSKHESCPIPICRVTLIPKETMDASTSCCINDSYVYGHTICLLCCLKSKFSNSSHLICLDMDIFTSSVYENDIMLIFSSEGFDYEPNLPFLTIKQLDYVLSCVKLKNVYVHPKNRTFFQRNNNFTASDYDLETLFASGSCFMVIEFPNRIASCLESINLLIDERVQVSLDQIQSILDYRSLNITTPSYLEQLFLLGSISGLVRLHKSSQNTDISTHIDTVLNDLVQKCAHKLTRSTKKESDNVYLDLAKNLIEFIRLTHYSSDINFERFLLKLIGFYKLNELFKSDPIFKETVYRPKEFKGQIYLKAKDETFDMLQNSGPGVSKMLDFTDLNNLLLLNFIYSDIPAVNFYVFYVIHSQLHHNSSKIMKRVVKYLRIPDAYLPSFKSLYYCDQKLFDASLKNLQKTDPKYYLITNQHIYIAFNACRHSHSSILLTKLIFELMRDSKIVYECFLDNLVQFCGISHVLAEIDHTLTGYPLKIFWEALTKYDKILEFLKLVTTSSRYGKLAKLLREQIPESVPYLIVIEKLNPNPLIFIPSDQKTIEVEGNKLIDQLARATIKAEANRGLTHKDSDSEVKGFLFDVNNKILNTSTKIEASKPSELLEYTLVVPTVPEVSMVETMLDVRQIEYFMNIIKIVEAQKEEPPPRPPPIVISRRSKKKYAKLYEDIKKFVDENVEVIKKKKTDISYFESTRGCELISLIESPSPPKNQWYENEVMKPLPEIAIAENEIEKPGNEPLKAENEPETATLVLPAKKTRKVGKRKPKPQDVENTRTYSLRSRQTSAASSTVASTQVSELNTSHETLDSFKSVSSRRSTRLQKKNRTDIFEDFLMGSDVVNLKPNKNNESNSPASSNTNSQSKSKRLAKSISIQPLRRSTRTKK